MSPVSPANDRRVNTGRCFRAGKALDQIARLLLGHRDDEIGLLEHLGMPLEIGGGRFVADVDADFAQRHPRVERDQAHRRAHTARCPRR